MQQGYCAIAYSAKVDGAAVTNTTTETSLLPAGAKWTFPTMWFQNVGNGLWLKAAGRVSTLVTTPGTLTLKLKFGSIIIAQSQAFVLSTTAKTNVSWYLDWLLTQRATGGGTAANLMHDGTFTSEALGATSVAGEAKTECIQGSAPAVGAGFDETAANQLDLTATWSVANAANSILLHQCFPINLGSP